MAKRTPRSAVIVPSVVNWKANHYAAVIREENGRYVVEDPTFGPPIIVSKAALDAESTGYFLIPDAPLPEGWEQVGVDEAKKVWGMGNTGDHDPNGTKMCDFKAKADCGSNCGGMATYNFHLQVVSLNIMDTPVGYTPPRGPDMHFSITYNQREITPSGEHLHSNFGSKWVCNWIAWLDGDPTGQSPGDAVTVVLPGGGRELHTVSGGVYSVDPQSGASLAIFPDPNNGHFERSLPDGSKQVFTKRDYFPFDHSNAVYMTQLIDPAGNALNFNYDSTFRLISVTDALNQTTTITHLSDTSGDPGFYLISRITDPFGRSATFDYQNGQVVAIHDTVGITSQFIYATPSDTCGFTGPCPADFIKSMTTPYGTTTFSQPDSSLDATTGCSSTNSNARVIQAVDPYLAVERVEFGHSAPGIPATETVLPVVPGINIYNGVYNYRNSFYWDKQATALYPPTHNSTCNCDVYDFTKAKLVHWLHVNDGTGNTVSNIKEREKMPLENAVYYFYANQPNTYNGTAFTGSNGWPTAVARVLDDGSTQLWQYQYNSIGKMTKSTDPSDAS